MKWMLSGVCAILVIWSLVAYWMIPASSADGRQVLTWITDDNPARRAQIKLFNSLNPDLELRLDATNIGLEKSIVQCIGGVGPDLIDMHYQEHLKDLARTGVLLPLKDLAKQWGISPERTWREMGEHISMEQFNPDTGEYEHIQYAFPCNVDAPVYLYNKRMFDEIGEPYPTDDWDWEEYLAKAKKLVRRDAKNRITRFAIGAYEYWEIIELIWQNGGSLYDPTRTYCTLDSPQAIEAIDFLQRITYRGSDKITPTIAERDAMAGQGGWGAGKLDLFAEEKTAMIRVGRWGMVFFRNCPNLKGNIGAVQVPGKTKRVVMAGGRTCGINRRSKNREAALRFLQFLASEPYSRQIVQFADALPPMEDLVRSETFLHDPKFPEEDFNHVFSEAVRRARVMEDCPFIQQQRVFRKLDRYVTLLRDKRLSAEELCSQLAAEVNGELKTNLTRYASMRAEYKRRTGREFDPNNYPPTDGGS